jgi:hypothetical protein
MLTIWCRHTPKCLNRAKGRAYLKCNCPLWADGYVNGKRTLRQSLETRDLARARKKAVALESPENRILKTVEAAISDFLGHCKSNGLGVSQQPEPAEGVLRRAGYRARQRTRHLPARYPHTLQGTGAMKALKRGGIRG